MFVIGKPFQPNLMLARKPLAYPREKNLKDSSLSRLRQSLLADIILSLKALPRSNTLANYKSS